MSKRDWDWSDSPYQAYEDDVCSCNSTFCRDCHPQRIEVPRQARVATIRPESSLAGAFWLTFYRLKRAIRRTYECRLDMQGHAAQVALGVVLIVAAMIWATITGWMEAVDNRLCICQHRLKRHGTDGPCNDCLCRRFIAAT